MLEKLVFGATQTERDCWISSPQHLRNIGKGIQGLRDCEIEKGLIPGVGCVDVLEVRVSSGVGVLSSSLRPPA